MLRVQQLQTDFPETDVHDRRLRVVMPDADGPGFVSLNGGFGEENRSLIGHKRYFSHAN